MGEAYITRRLHAGSAWKTLSIPDANQTVEKYTNSKGYEMTKTSTVISELIGENNFILLPYRAINVYDGFNRPGSILVFIVRDGQCHATYIFNENSKLSYGGDIATTPDHTEDLDTSLNLNVEWHPSEGKIVTSSEFIDFKVGTKITYQYQILD